MAAVHRYRATCSWEGTTAVGYDRYVRNHAAAAPPVAAELALSGDAAFGGDPTRLNPEQLLVLAATSCQLLSFLAVASRARIDVRSYTDEAEAEMPEDDRPVRITRIVLRPQMTVVEGPSRERIRHLVEVAHRECYIANSVRTEIVIEPQVTFVSA
jgi:organic hydroperoxide reductase OsmC/OhrA